MFFYAGVLIFQILKQELCMAIEYVINSCVLKWVMIVLRVSLHKQMIN